jgi:hypothetical protein
MMAAGASHPCAFSASENQKPNMVQGLQMRRSRGVTSISMLVHVPSSAKEDCGRGMIHPERDLFFLIECLRDRTRWRMSAILAAESLNICTNIQYQQSHVYLYTLSLSLGQFQNNKSGHDGPFNTKNEARAQIIHLIYSISPTVR